MKKFDFAEVAQALNNVRTLQIKANKVFTLRELKNLLFNCGAPKTIDFYNEFIKTAWLEREGRGKYRWNAKYETIPMKYLVSVYQRSVGARRVRKKTAKEAAKQSVAVVSHEEAVEVSHEDKIEQSIKFLSRNGYRIFKEVITLEEVTQHSM